MRLQIVQFAETWKSHRADWKMFTAHHFLAGGISKSTIYGVLQRYGQRGSVKRFKGSGRPLIKMKLAKKAKLRRSVNHRTGLSQRFLASRFVCMQGYISRMVKRLKIRCLKCTKCPGIIKMIRQNEKQQKDVQSLYKGLDFAIDDGKYFGLTGYQMSGNKFYYTSDKHQMPSHIATFSKKKFEPKVMLWIAISPKCISRPVLTSGQGMAVNSSTYITKCLNLCLVPFLRKSTLGGYVFWPDKASSYYAATTTTFLDNK